MGYKKPFIESLFWFCAFGQLLDFPQNSIKLPQYLNNFTTKFFQEGLRFLTVHRPNCLPQFFKLEVHFVNTSWMSNIAFLTDWAQIADLDFGLIHKNISIKEGLIPLLRVPFLKKSSKVWLNSYFYITSNW